MRSLKKFFVIAFASIVIIGFTVVLFRQTQFIAPLLKTAERIYEKSAITNLLKPSLPGSSGKGSIMEQELSARKNEAARRLTTDSRTIVAEVSMALFRANALDRNEVRRLADLSLAAGQFRDAVEVLEQLLFWYPEDEAIWKKAVSAYEAVGYPQKALALYDRLLQRHPDDILLTVSAAKTFAWAGRITRALQLYDGAIKSGRGNDVIRTEYADLLYRDKQYSLAAMQYREVWSKGWLEKAHALDFTRSLLALGNHAEAGDVLDTLAKRYPADPEVLEVSADFFFTLKKYDRAAELYGKLIAGSPEKPLFYNRLASVALAKGDYPQALKISREILRLFPENEEAMLTIARVSSWQRDYRTSLDYYDQLIELVHADLRYYREKARVLGWMSDYGRALKLYDETLQIYPRNVGLRAEAEAKRAYYSNAYRHAVKSYKAWLAAEPQHPEALFDLGQLYMQNSRWKEAADTCDSLLAAVIDHHQAGAAREKTVILSSMMRLNTGGEYFSAKSADRLTDVRYTGMYTSLYYPLQDRVSVFLNLDRKSYHFDKNPLTPLRQSVTVGFEYLNKPDIFLRAAYRLQHKSGTSEDSPTGFVEAESSVLDNIHLGLAFRREDVIQNYETFQGNLQRSRWQGRVSYDADYRWNAGADYAFDHYSDGNTQATGGADITMHLLYDPHRLNLIYRVQNYGFSKHRDLYWTPSSFLTHTAGVEWQYYLNKDRFIGAKDTYCTAAYLLTLEQDHNFSHKIHAGVHHDWSNRFTTSLEYQHSWNTKTSVYQDKKVNAELLWHF